MKYAVVQIGGKQFKITEGQTIKVEHQDKLKFDVLAYFNGKETVFGTPLLKDVNLDASIVSHALGKKVKVVRFKAKSRYKKNKGFRQPYTWFKIDGISQEGEVKPAKVEKTEKVEKAPVAKKEVKKEVKKTSEKTSVKKVVKKETK